MLELVIRFRGNNSEMPIEWLSFHIPIVEVRRPSKPELILLDRQKTIRPQFFHHGSQTQPKNRAPKMPPIVQTDEIKDSWLSSVTLKVSAILPIELAAMVVSKASMAQPQPKTNAARELLVSTKIVESFQFTGIGLRDQSSSNSHSRRLTHSKMPTTPVEFIQSFQQIGLDTILFLDHSSDFNSAHAIVFCRLGSHSCNI